MTDERIKEEFVEFMQKTVPIRDIDLSRTLVCCVGDSENIMIQSHAVGFIAGFRAAERLAKIEVLEKVVKKLAIQDTPVPVGSNFSDYMHGACDNVGESMRLVNIMIAELKEEVE